MFRLMSHRYDTIDEVPITEGIQMIGGRVTYTKLVHGVEKSTAVEKSMLKKMRSNKMRKRTIFAMLILVVTTSFVACGNNAEEPVKEEAETPVVEEAKAESESVVEEKEPEEVKEETEEKEPENDHSYAQLYLTEIAKLYDSGDADQFALVNVDGDDIPELVACHSEGPCRDNTFLYTVYNGEIALLESGAAGFDGYSIEFSEGNNTIYTGSSMGGFNNICFKKIYSGKLEEVFSAQDIGILNEEEETESYSINGKEVSKTEYDDQLWEFVSEYNPFTSIDFDGLNTVEYSIEDMYIGNQTETKTYMTYEEITAELTNLRA